MTERRTTRRRRLPFVRSAILEVGARSHIVTLADMSAEGAFLSTRLSLDPERAVTLRVVLPRDGRVIALRCSVVRSAARFDAASGLPAGIAVRFEGLDAAAARRIEEFASETFLPAPDRKPLDRYEYRSLERARLDEAELNRLGRDGWQLAAALATETGLRLLLMRRS